MSTPAERRAFAAELARAVLTYKNENVVGKNGPDVYALLVKAAGTLDERIPVQGKHPDGRPIGGTTTLRQETAFAPFRGWRDRRIEAGATAAAEGVEEVRSLVDGLSLAIVEALGDKLPALPEENDDKKKEG